MNLTPLVYRPYPRDLVQLLGRLGEGRLQTQAVANGSVPE
jgi:hypothetical protein